MLTESTTETMTREKVVFCQHFCFGEYGLLPHPFPLSPRHYHVTYFFPVRATTNGVNFGNELCKVHGCRRRCRFFFPTGFPRAAKCCIMEIWLINGVYSLLVAERKESLCGCIVT